MRDPQSSGFDELATVSGQVVDVKDRVNDLDLLRVPRVGAEVLTNWHHRHVLPQKRHPFVDNSTFRVQYVAISVFVSRC